MLKGYIFDMDGTLVDSMGMIMKMDEEIFERLSLPVSEEATQAMKYIPLGESAALLKSMYDLPQTESELSDIMYNAMRDGYRTVTLKHGVAEYLELAEKAGIRMCIATATEPEIALEVSRRLGIMKYMEFLVACSDVGAPKSRPDVFLEASRRFGIAPQELAVFEDGLPGASSAHEAGFKVVGVYDEPSSNPDTERRLKCIGDIYINSFCELGNKLI